MAAKQTTSCPTPTAIIRLDELGAELARLGWQTRMTGDTGPLPALLIRSSAPGTPAITEHIYAVEMGRRWFYWWSRSCGADAADTAAIIARVMRPAT